MNLPLRLAITAVFFTERTVLVTSFTTVQQQRARQPDSHLAAVSPEWIAESSNVLATVAAGLQVEKVPATTVLNNVLSVLDIADHPATTIVGSYLLVTASDMIPFVPCQPLAIALGAKLGFAWAFPITSAGQTTAGLLAFSAARRAADSELVQEKLQDLNKAGDAKTLQKFKDLKRMTSEEEQDATTILLALAGLRLAPFFPFSAGNYLLGGATAVPLSLFAVATFLGCLLSNLLSTSVGAGGALLFQSQTTT